MSDTTNILASLTEAQVRSAYRNHLWREPDAAGRRAWEGRKIAPEALAAIFSASEEHCLQIAPILELVRRTTSPRIMLFGAYGNGNLGDDIQAEAIAELIRRAVPGAGLFATSCFDGDYPFESGTKLRRGAIYSHTLLAEFDLLVIGGGGLLAHPHEPLSDPEWAEDLVVPTMFFGVGVHGSFVADAARVLSKAAFVGCRDASSLEWAAAHSSRIALTLDPVLLAAAVALPARLASAGKRRYRRCWIVRGPIDDIVRDIRAKIGPQDVVIGVEPLLDQALCEIFPELLLVHTLEQALELICASDVVVSMRYHGVILAMKAGVSAYALRIAKAERLLALLGHSGRTITDLAGFEADVAPIALEPQLQFWQTAGLVHLQNQFRGTLARSKTEDENP